MMDRINIYDLEPGTYQHYRGDTYVVVDVLTHLDNPTTGKMERLTDPLVVYRDLQPPIEHLNGKAQPVHNRYGKKLSEFTGMVHHNGKQVKRFKPL